MPLPLLPQLPPVKGEEPTPVCATLLPHLWEMFHKGTAPGLGWCQSLAGPRWLCHSACARLTLPGSLMAGLGMWQRERGMVPQECCRRSCAGPTQQGLLCPGGTEECRIHTEFPLSIPRNGCSQLPCLCLVCPAQPDNINRARPGGV